MLFQDKTKIHLFLEMAGFLFLFASTLFGGEIPHLLGQFHQHLMWFSDTIDLRRLQDCKFVGFSQGEMVQT